MVRQLRTISTKKIQDSPEGERYSAMDVESMYTSKEIITIILIDQVEILNILGETHTQNSRANSKQSLKLKKPVCRIQANLKLMKQIVMM